MIRGERGNLAEPVHILVLVSVKGLRVFGPADGGLRDAGGLTGKCCLDIHSHSDVSGTLCDGGRHWNKSFFFKYVLKHVYNYVSSNRKC